MNFIFISLNHLNIPIFQTRRSASLSIVMQLKRVQPGQSRCPNHSVLPPPEVQHWFSCHHVGLKPVLSFEYIKHLCFSSFVYSSDSSNLHYRFFIRCSWNNTSQHIWWTIDCFNNINYIKLIIKSHTSLYIKRKRHSKRVGVGSETKVNMFSTETFSPLTC